MLETFQQDWLLERLSNRDGRPMSRIDRYTPEYLDSMSFTNLVRAIDEKWSHTYQAVDYVKPELNPLQEILAAEGYLLED